MSIFEQARRGELLGGRVRRLSSASLNSQDPETGLTLLATAVLSGVPAEVEQLLERGAVANKRCKNNETPLLLATWQATVERPLMVQALLPYLDKESLNHTCRSAWGNTPIMWAVEKIDADSVRLLAKAGAKIKIKNDDGETAEGIAVRVGKKYLINCLRPDEEQALFSRLATGVAYFGRHVVSWVDKKFSGFMGKVFKFKGEKHNSVEAKMKEMRASPAKPTASNSAKPAAGNPAKPAASNPAKPTTSNPAKPMAANPTKPTTSNSAKPMAVNPAKPAAVNPAKPTASNPAKPTASNSAKPMAVNPAKPAAANPAKPTASNLAKPMAVNPTKPAAGNLAKPMADDPAEPTAGDPTTSNPAKPTADNPAEPTAVNPAKPTAGNPAKPVAVNPAEPTAGDPATSNRAKPTAVNPAKPTASNPAEPTADDPAKLTAGDPTADDPAEPTEPMEPTAGDPTEDDLAEPTEPTADEFVQQVDDYVKSTPTLSIFFKDDNRFMQNMATKLVDLAKDTTTDLASPQVLPMTIEVTMHQQVIYCDDSSSMTNRKGTAEKRWENQKELALRIAKIGTLILPDDQGVALRFINQRTADESANLDLEALGRGFESVSPRGDTPIGTTLRERILEPLVLQPLAEGRFKRPLLVSILTDGGPSREDPGKLARVILECGSELVKNGYPMDCVKFLVGQIGSSKEAVDFLDTLRGNSDIDKVTYVFAGRFDDKFKSFRDQRALDRWLVTTLYQPLANAERRKA
ncbi:hypothetical protein RB598_006939 [Gaeumannomyces tritici]